MVRGLGMILDEYTFEKAFVFFPSDLSDLSSCHRWF